MTDYIEQHLSEIKELSIFKELGEKELAKVLTNSQIRNFKKGKNIFFQDEKSLYLHVILTGAVKTFITNEDGEEAILQIIDEDNFINDFSDEKYRSSARAVKNSTILSISLINLKEAIGQIPQLTLNILNALSLRYKSAITQIGNLKLEDAKEKVGHFLLESAFKNSNEKTTEFELKFDKASIASYLGIRSETLSRTLQKLKDDGEISIEKNKIILLHKKSLCHYCNSEISEKCQDRHSDFCEYDKI